MESMFFKRYQRLISPIILMVMLFASLAPTVSHALTHFTGNQTFTQQICSSNGSKLVIQVKTTMGQQLNTELPRAVDQTQVDDFTQHFAHCPFCSHASSVAVLPEPPSLMVAKLEADAQQATMASTLIPDSHLSLFPPSQAPPQSLNN